MRTLYGKDSKGDLRVWGIYTEGSEVVVKHGKLGGKVQEKRYTAEGKSHGKSNETTPEQQSVLEDSKPTSVILVNGVTLRDENDADQYFEAKTSQGYEGVVYRNLDAKYEFGKRSYNLIKRKKRETTEATVYHVEMDRNGWGILYCKLDNSIEFKCQMKVEAAEKNYRLYENALELIGKTIEIEFEALSDSGTPQKPVSIGIREVDKYGRALV